jgi:hypothetical protein
LHTFVINGGNTQHRGSIMAGQEREIPTKRKRGSKHKKQRAKRPHTQGRNRSTPTYQDEARVFTKREWDYMVGYGFREPKSVITTKGRFDEAGNYHSDD